MRAAWALAWSLLVLYCFLNLSLASLTSCDLNVTPAAVGVKRADLVTLRIPDDCAALIGSNVSTSVFSVAFGNQQIALNNPLRSFGGRYELDVTPPAQPLPGVVDLRVIQDGVSIIHLPQAFSYYGFFAVDLATLDEPANLNIYGRAFPTVIKPSASLQITLKGKPAPYTFPLVIQSYTETKVSAVSATDTLSVLSVHCCTSGSSGTSPVLQS